MPTTPVTAAVVKLAVTEKHIDFSLETRAPGSRGYPLMQISGRRRATRRARPALSAAATTAPTSL
jgi:hypothetical protein